MSTGVWDATYGEQGQVNSNVPSSLVPRAVDCGCTVGPDALGCRPGGGRAEGALVGLEVGGTRCGYCRRAAPVAVLVTLEDEEPIPSGVFLCVWVRLGCITAIEG